MPRSIATDTEVDRAALEDFLRPRHHAILGTTRADGDIQVSPVTMGLGQDGSVLIASYPERAKVRVCGAGPRHPSASSRIPSGTRGSNSRASARSSIFRTPSTAWSSTSVRSAANTPTGTSTARPWSRRARCSSRSTSNVGGRSARVDFRRDSPSPEPHRYRPPPQTKCAAAGAGVMTVVTPSYP